MGSYFSGTRVIDATDGVDSSASLMDDAEDEILQVFQARRISLVNNPMLMTTNEWEMSLSDASAYPAWRNPSSAAGSNRYLHFGVPLYVGQVITGVYAIVSGTNGANLGAIEFMYGALGSTLSSQDITGGTTNPWDTSGEAWANKVTYSLTAAPFPLTITADYLYALRFTSSNTNSDDNYIWDAYVTAKQGS
jgi:hypothetical protein